jgi:hypothetical protein
MIHLGFSGFYLFCRMGGAVRRYPAVDPTATQASQNAAAILFDLGTVDIR